MLGILGAGEWVRSKGHAVKSQWNAAMAAVDLMQVCHAVEHSHTVAFAAIWQMQFPCVLCSCSGMPLD